jgi:hypothetical protein
MNGVDKIMENNMLSDPGVYPGENILEKALDKEYKYYKSLMEKTTKENLTAEWNYYKDGKSWLCKMTDKKKTICWLSIWDTGIKISFFFTEKTINGINGLEISNEIKETAYKTKPIGKLLPIIFMLDKNDKIDDAIKIAEYKMKIT